MSICDGHDLGALAALGLPNAKTPFFALLKVPSIKASRTSMLPRSCRSLAKAWSAFSIVPSRAHCWKRRWQVWYGGYWLGKSRHRAPVLSTQRMPLSTSRAGVLGRPRLISEVSGSNKGEIMFHWGSVSFILTLDHISRPVSITNLKTDLNSITYVL